MLIEREVSFENSLVTVNQVDITPDLRQCHVFVSVIGDQAAKHSALSKLAGARTTLQAAVAKRVTLKYTPRLHFHLDESGERGARIGEILDELDVPQNEAAEMENHDERE